MALYGDTAYQLTISTSTSQSVNDLIARVRRNIREADAEYFSDNDILGWLNEAHQELYDEVCMLFSRFFQVTSNISFVADQVEYTLPTDFKRLLLVERAKSGGISIQRPTKLHPIHYNDKNDFNQFLLAPSTRYYLVGSSKIGFVPTPTVADTDAIRLTYVTTPTVLALSGTYNIPFNYSRLLVLLATYMCLTAEKEPSGRSFYELYQRGLLNMQHELSKQNDDEPGRIRVDYRDDF